MKTIIVVLLAAFIVPSSLQARLNDNSEALERRLGAPHGKNITKYHRGILVAEGTYTYDVKELGKVTYTFREGKVKIVTVTITKPSMLSLKDSSELAQKLAGPGNHGFTPEKLNNQGLNRYIYMVSSDGGKEVFHKGQTFIVAYSGLIPGVPKRAQNRPTIDSL